jgi:hypothetical protein
MLFEFEPTAKIPPFRRLIEKMEADDFDHDEEEVRRVHKSLKVFHQLSMKGYLKQSSKGPALQDSSRLLPPSARQMKMTKMEAPRDHECRGWFPCNRMMMKMILKFLSRARMMMGTARPQRG